MHDRAGLEPRRKTEYATSFVYNRLSVTLAGLVILDKVSVVRNSARMRLTKKRYIAAGS